VPGEATNLALILEDPDAPRGTFTHWIVFGIPPDETQLPEGFQSDQRSGVLQGKNDFGSTGYGAPCPPRGPAHRYIFTLYALNQRPNLGPGASRRQFLDAIQGHILAQAELTSRYARS
jgi:Raf kinase inhibitor-like YbhB/YbcL family protein